MIVRLLARTGDFEIQSDRNGFNVGDHVLLGGDEGAADDGEPLTIASFDMGVDDSVQMVVFDTCLTCDHKKGALMVLDARSLCLRCGRVGPHRCSLLLGESSRTREERRMAVKAEVFGVKDTKLVMNRRPKIGRTLFLQLRKPWIKDVTHRACVCTLCFSANMMAVALVEHGDVFRELSPVLATIIDAVEARAKGGSVPRTVRMDDLLHCLCGCPVNDTNGFINVKCALMRCTKCNMLERLRDISRCKAIRESKKMIQWDGYQKEVSVKKKLKVVPAYAEHHAEVEVLNADGHRLRKMSRKPTRKTTTTSRQPRTRTRGRTDKKEVNETQKKNTAMERVRYAANTMYYMLHLVSMVQLFAKHQFINLWQHTARAGVWESFPDDAVLVEMDFAENFTIIVQDEQQAGHWVHKQV